MSAAKAIADILSGYTLAAEVDGAEFVSLLADRGLFLVGPDDQCGVSIDGVVYTLEELRSQPFATPPATESFPVYRVWSVRGADRHG